MGWLDRFRLCGVWIYVGIALVFWGVGFLEGVYGGVCGYTQMAYLTRLPNVSLLDLIWGVWVNHMQKFFAPFCSFQV